MNFWKNLRRIFFPKKCIICTDPIPYEEKVPICDDCIEAWDDQIHMECHTCGAMAKDCNCIPKELRSVSSFACWSVFYTGNMEPPSPDMIIYYLKKFNSWQVYDFCAEMMVKSIRSQCAKHNENYKEYVVTYSPRSPQKYYKIGVDQSEELAKEISKKLGIPFVKSLENVGSKEQKKLNREQRIKNAQTSYRLHKNFESKNYKYFLVDDVLTTGATLYHCAELLLKSGAQAVVPVTYCKDNIKKGDIKNAKRNIKYYFTRIVKGTMRNGTQ